MTDSALRQQISREVKRALSDAGLSAAAAAKSMGGKKRGKLIYRWINAEVTAPLDNLSEFASAVGQPIVIRLGPQDMKESPPAWAEGLVRMTVAEVLAARDAELDGQVARLEDQIERLSRLPDGPPPSRSGQGASAANAQADDQ